jgi:hypothetical protein
MKRSRFAVVTIFLLLGACTQFESSQSSDTAITTYQPSANELRLAENRARGYWASHKSELSGKIRYLGVQSGSIFDSDIPDLDSIIMTSPAVNDLYREQYLTNDDVDIYGVSIFDVNNGKLVSPIGYAVLDLPARGQVARFGPYMALYIGDSKSGF